VQHEVDDVLAGRTRGEEVSWSLGALARDRLRRLRTNLTIRAPEAIRRGHFSGSFVHDRRRMMTATSFAALQNGSAVQLRTEHERTSRSRLESDVGEQNQQA
jgi:hypothetical protein